MFFKTGVLKNVPKITGNNCAGVFFNKGAGPQQIFTGDCFSNLLELSMVFGPVKNSSENVHISLKTKSKHQVTYLKIQIISKS